MPGRPYRVIAIPIGVALLAAIALGSWGCAFVGPRSITTGRMAYADVINRTDDEQILNAIVRLRYDETSSMVAVSSITASLQFTALLGTNIGVGSQDNYAGNLVPLSAGAAYEENPTISYQPLTGEDFMRRMLSPVSTSQWLLLGGPAVHPGYVFSLAVQRINGLRNPRPGEGPPGRELARFTELYDRLRRAGVLDIVREDDRHGEDEYFADFHDYAGSFASSVRELFDLVGIDAKVDGSTIRVPFLTGVGRSSSELRVQMRSAYEVLQVFAAGIDVPAEHIDAGFAEPVAWMPPDESRLFHIHSSKRRPSDAIVKVRYRDYWFYIDSTDLMSKRAFLFLRTFIGMRLAAPPGSNQTPILTVPVK